MSRAEFEEVVRNPIGQDSSESSGRPIRFGYSSGRKLAVVYEMIDDITVFQITAWSLEGAIMADKRPKITARKLAEIRALRKKIDHEEKDQIIAKASAAFSRHEKIKKTIARLRDARIAKQLTLEQVSAISGIGKANLSRLENDESPNPTIDTVLRISDAIGLEVLA